MNFDYPGVSAITENMDGFYRISHEAYHDGPGFSSSLIKRALKSYAEYQMPQREDTESMAFGRAFHMSILEPHLFKLKYVVAPHIAAHKNSNAYKEQMATWREQHAGREILSIEDDAKLNLMSRSVRLHPEFHKMAESRAEVMGITTCKETGLLLKCKADAMGPAIYDLKTTSFGVQPEEFQSEVLRYGYHVSAAFYQDLIAQICGERLPFILVPVLKKPPFECEFFELDDGYLAEGRKLYKAALRRIKRWESMLPERAVNSDKRLRVLHVSARAVYSTTSILNFIEDSHAPG